MPNSTLSASNSTETTVKTDAQHPWEDFDTLLRHAERARSTNDKARARTLYARVVELNPNDPRGWTGLAETAVSTDEAIISWAYTLALAPNSWEARIQMDAYIEERINKSGVADAAVLLALARTLAEVGQKPSAYRLVTHSTELDPTNVEAWLWRAGITEDRADAVDCLRHVLSLDPNNAQARAGLEWEISRQHQPTFKPPVDASGAINLYEKGKTALHNGNLADAHALFVQATELDPNNESVWFMRGSTAPNTDEGLQCMEQTLRLNPRHQAAKDAMWYLRVKKYRESFAIRTSPPLALDEPASAVPSTPQSKRQFPMVWLGGLAILILVVALLFLFWR
ncbi:MAG: hypothetical protein HZB51_05945 [Chloroflexi bacterium]|nr:hypothetical protein [Chloroflexota bacterium]